MKHTLLEFAAIMPAFALCFYLPIIPIILLQNQHIPAIYKGDITSLRFAMIMNT